MPKVDFANPYLRMYLRTYRAEHRRHLLGVAEKVPLWAARSREEEERFSAAEGRAPRPLAAILDIDEVLLCNIHDNAFVGEQGGRRIEFHAADYFDWPRGHRLNPLLPGASELLEALRKEGVTPFLLTGRLESIRDETIENLVLVGLAGKSEPDQPLKPQYHFNVNDLDLYLIMCPDREYPTPGGSVRPFKESRRRAIDATHRIVLNIGDQVSDLGLYGDIQVHCMHPFYHTP